MNQKHKICITTLHDFVEIQVNSFCWFLSEGLNAELENFSSILDFTKNLEVRFFGNEYKLKKPKYSIFESKQRDSTYSVRIYVPIEIINKETKFNVKRKAFLGELPLMTNQGTFVINGCERVIINQIVRSPGIYYKKDISLKDKYNYNATLISNRGAWVKFELVKDKESKKDNVFIRLDKSTAIPAIKFLHDLGLKSNEIENSLEYLDSGPKFQTQNQIEPVLDSVSASYENLLSVKDNYTNSLENKDNLYNRIFEYKYYDLGKVGRYKLNQKLNLNVSEEIRTLTPQDIIAIINYLSQIKLGNGVVDDIDHLQNRRVRSVGELLQNQFRVGLNRLERTIRERLTISDSTVLKSTSLINPKPIIAAMKEFFGSSQLSQFMDQTNPLASITHKRRISSLGPGGLNRDHVSFAVRDIHPSHYGRVCPIETPEGQNAGLIASLAAYARVNSYGFIETPFFPVLKGQVIRKNSAIYMTADKEDSLRIAPADTPLTNLDKIKNEFVPARYNQEFNVIASKDVDFISVSPVQVISAAACLIPFLEHDDANRALMGSNMQRQAVPLLYPQKPIVGSGFESQLATDSGMVLISEQSGVVRYVSSDRITIEDHNTKNNLLFTKVLSFKSRYMY
jgi:DNA-directed RNA polymerase subunit beta